MQFPRKHSPSLSKIIVLILSVTTLLMTSCLKDDHDIVYPSPAGVALIHASSNTGELDLYSNSNKVGLDKFAYNTVVNYLTASPGGIEFSVTKKDSTEILAKKTFFFQSTKTYSLFVVDTLNTSTFKLFEDTLATPAANKARIRFINLSASERSLDLGISGQANPVFTKLAFKQASAFIDIDPAVNYTFQINENGKPAILATLPDTKIETGKIYTIWAKGSGSIPAPVSISVMTNK